MITKTEKSIFRSTLFRHLDGIVTAPTAYTLFEKGVTEFILEKQTVSLSELASKFDANEGYLNVALRILCSQSWLNQKVDNENNEVIFSINENSPIAFKLFYLYKEVNELLKLSEKHHSRKFELKPFLALENIFEKHKNNFDLVSTEDENVLAIRHQILKHIEGIILGPTLVHLGMNGMFHKYFMQASFKPEEFHSDAKSFERLLTILTHYDFFEQKNDTFKFTNKGLFFARRAAAYGVTVSYIPTLRKLDELIFGNPKAAKSSATENKEGHVDRAMNVWGSGGAHTAYFKIIDEIIIEIFNRPIEQQPKGILDMGCGNGAFLQHLFDIIEKRTLRGQILEEHPLFLVGADYNQEALKITKANLIQADIWSKVVWGDIGNPTLLADDLKEDYGIDLADLLNVRTFLDHNRIWNQPTKLAASFESLSSGSFAFEGKRINNNLVEASLAEHFEKWQPYVSKFGLLLIELHTVKPELVAQNIGRSPATAYDATHGYSDQYIVEVDVFHKVLKSIGLEADPNFFRKFPNTDLATVSINYLKGN